MTFFFIVFFVLGYTAVLRTIPPAKKCYLQEGLEIELHGRGGEVEAELLQNLGVEDTERSNDLGLSLLAEVDVCAS